LFTVVITMLAALLVMAPFYGGGALLMREITRRSRRGWPTLTMLGFAFAMLEEAYTTQTLFKPALPRGRHAPARTRVHPVAGDGRAVDRINWGSRHRLALAGGAALTYAWHRFPAAAVVSVSQRIDLASNVIFTGALLVVLSAAARRNPLASVNDER
jgi:hypothetical protein